MPMSGISSRRLTNLITKGHLIFSSAQNLQIRLVYYLNIKIGVLLSGDIWTSQNIDDTDKGKVILVNVSHSKLVSNVV